MRKVAVHFTHNTFDMRFLNLSQCAGLTDANCARIERRSTRRSDLFREIFRPEFTGSGKRRCYPQLELQFAYIAWPGVCHEEIEYIGGKGSISQELLSERLDVLAPFPESWHVYRQSIDTAE